MLTIGMMDEDVQGLVVQPESQEDRRKTNQVR